MRFYFLHFIRLQKRLLIDRPCHRCDNKVNLTSYEFLSTFYEFFSLAAIYFCMESLLLLKIGFLTVISKVILENLPLLDLLNDCG